MKFKIFYKFLFLILFFTLFPLIWLGIILINKAQFGIKTPISELHINRVEGIKKSVTLKIDYYDKMVASIDEFFRTSGEWNERQKMLSSLFNSYDEISSLSLLNNDGDEIIKIVKSQKYESKNITKSLLDLSRKNGKAVSFENGRMVFVFFKKSYFIKIEIDENEFLKDIGAENIGEKSGLLIVNREGKVLFKISGYQKLSWEDIVKSEPIINYISNKADGTVEMSYAENDYLGAISNLSDINVSIISIQEVSDAYKYAMSIKKEAIAVLITFSLLVVFVSYFLSKGLSNPIIKFIEASKRIAQRDFSVSVKVSTKDELEDLAENFNLMVSELDKYSKMQIEKILMERQNTQAVMYSTEEGIIMVDLQNKIQLINRKAVSIIGAESENLEGKDIFESIKNEHVKDSVKTAINSDKKQYEFELEHKNYKRFYRVFINDIKMKDKEDTIGYLITFYDITYDKELEKIKEDFLHSITHDLRNPVSAIKGFAEFLLKEIAGPINQNQRNMVVSIDRAAFRLLQMVNNILDIAKMESGKMELNITKFNVYELVKKSVDLMAPLAQKKAIKFEIKGDSNVEINADANLIERLYINLIGNAIKFTPDNGTITVGFETYEGKFKSWVEDTGEGIPLEYIDKVFGKFEQVKGQKAGGTGLGLTISKHITEAHLGKIWAEYRPNMGAKFVFEFPINLSKDEFGKVISSK
ncbi:MAG TPA: ATP-binding protein [Elusimicrobiales bacterium]|nr:ATP-binding protein [Elusimicrobiales bacterium]HPO94506.1 ATP-binding protein [Elusimicrobiales bacterium]